jgi:hypothetical protein
VIIMPPLTNAERQALWRERQKQKLSQSHFEEVKRLSAESYRRGMRIAELEREMKQKAEALSHVPMPPRYLIELLAKRVDGMDLNDPDLPTVKEFVFGTYWRIVEDAAPLIDDCRDWYPTHAEDIAMWLGVRPDPVAGLTYRQFAEALVEAGIPQDELKETLRHVARSPKKALEIYMADNTRMSFGDAVRHRDLLKRLNLWRRM